MSTIPIPVSITANSYTIKYGDSIPNYNYLITTTDQSFDVSNISVDINPILCNATSNSSVGTYDIILNQSSFSSPGYNIAFTFINGTLTISKANLTITAYSPSKTYDGSAYTGSNSVTYSSFVNGETKSVLSGTLTYSILDPVTHLDVVNAVNAGSYNIVPSGLTSSNYDIKYEKGTLTILKAELTITADSKSKTYDGSAYTGAKSFQYTGLVNNEQFANVISGTVSYSILDPSNGYDAINAGLYDIVPSGLTSLNYDIAYVNGTLTISKAQLTITAYSQSKTYDGLKYSGPNSVTYSSFVNSETESVLSGTLSYSILVPSTTLDAVNVGSYDIVPSGLTSLNYDIKYENGTLAISKADLTITANSFTESYTGQSHKNSCTVSYSSFATGDNKNVLSGTLSYSIIDPLTSLDAIDAGLYDIIPSGLTSSNYNITYVNGRLTISMVNLTITAFSPSKTYDGRAYTGSNSVTYSQFVNGETDGVLNGTLSYSIVDKITNAVINTPIINPASYNIVPLGLTSKNYNIQYVNGTLSILKADLTITADSQSKTYDGSAYTGSKSFQYTGLVNNEQFADVVSGTVSYSIIDPSTNNAPVNGGQYNIVPSGLTALNYNIIYVNGILTILKVDLTITAGSKSKTYNGLKYTGPNSVTYSSFVNGENENKLNGTLSYSILDPNGYDAINVGLYDIIPSGLTSQNYNITYEKGTLTISKANLTITAVSQSKTYDGLAYTGPNSVTYSSFVNGEPASVLNGTLSYSILDPLTSLDAINVGLYDIVPSGLTSLNYNITYANGKLTISKANLTVNRLSTDYTYPYHSTIDYTKYYSITGFVNSETSSVLTGSPTIYLNNSSIPNVINTGTYDVSIQNKGTLTATNYNFVIQNTGTAPKLIITKIPLTITLAGNTKTYQYSTIIDYKQSYTFTGFATYADGYTEGISSLSGSPTLYLNNSPIPTSNIPVGTYQLSIYDIGTLTSRNYSFIINNTNPDTFIEIKKCEISIRADYSFYKYDGQPKNATIIYSIPTNQVSTLLQGNLIIKYESQSNYSVFFYDPPKNVGVYNVYLSGQTPVDSDNYSVSYGSGLIQTITVNLSISLKENFSKDYTGLNVDFLPEYSFSGFVNGETQSVLNGNLSYEFSYNPIVSDPINTAVINAGIYFIYPKGVTSNNYTITFKSIQLTINRLPLQITAVGYSSTYSYGETIDYTKYYTLSGFITVNGVTQDRSLVGGYPSISLNGVASLNPLIVDANANPYNLTITGPGQLSSQNYSFKPDIIPTTDAQTLKINKIPLTVVRQPQQSTFTYGQTISYIEYYNFTGFANNETRSVVKGAPTLYSNNSPLPSKVNTGTYNITIHDIGTLNATNYSIDNSRIDNSSAVPKLTINKATLTVSATTPSPGTFHYGDTPRLLYFCNFAGLMTSAPYNDTSSNISIGGDPSILLTNTVNGSTVNTNYVGQILNVGTYNITLTSISSLSSTNYVFTLSTPNTPPQLIINPLSITIGFNGVVPDVAYLKPDYPYYGSKTIQSDIYNTCVTLAPLVNPDTFSSMQYTDRTNTVQTISFKKSDNTLINSTDKPNTYTISLDISLLSSTFPNYSFSVSPTYSFTLPKGYLKISPLSGGPFIYGYKPMINDFYTVTGFVSNTETASNTCTGTPTMYITPQSQYYYAQSLYTTPIALNAGTYCVSVDKPGLGFTATSNYRFYIPDNSTIGRFTINPISLSDAGIKFTWTSYIPTIPYGVPLSSYQLNAVSPLNPYSNTPIGTIQYIGYNTSTTTPTVFPIGGTLPAGTYTLTATLTVTDPSYASQSISVTNSNKIQILLQYPSISQFNPLPVAKGTVLTSSDISRICNANINITSGSIPTVTYTDMSGNIINEGYVVNNNIEIVDQINNISNPNYHNIYTFTKFKLSTI
jgi:hypothetical protein